MQNNMKTKQINQPTILTNQIGKQKPMTALQIFTRQTSEKIENRDLKIENMDLSDLRQYRYGVSSHMPKKTQIIKLLNAQIANRQAEIRQKNKEQKQNKQNVKQEQLTHAQKLSTQASLLVAVVSCLAAIGAAIYYIGQLYKTEDQLVPRWLLIGFLIGCIIVLIILIVIFIRSHRKIGKLKQLPKNKQQIIKTQGQEPQINLQTGRKLIKDVKTENEKNEQIEYNKLSEGQGGQRQNTGFKQYLISQSQSKLKQGQESNIYQSKYEQSVEKNGEKE